jgi:hypothetical protein
MNCPGLRWRKRLGGRFIEKSGVRRQKIEVRMEKDKINYLLIMEVE